MPHPSRSRNNPSGRAGITHQEEQERPKRGGTACTAGGKRDGVYSRREEEGRGAPTGGKEGGLYTHPGT